VNGSTTNSLTITHDALGHLKGATGTGATGGWAYANQGDNLTSATSNGSPTTTYSYNPSDASQLASTTTSGVATYYTYDQSGHVTNVSPYSTNYCPTAYGSCLSYDAQGRLTQVNKVSGLNVRMTYNAQGQRMSYTAIVAGNNLADTFQYRGGELAPVTTSGTQNTTDTYL
jgi:YD repeat-containing protein